MVSSLYQFSDGFGSDHFRIDTSLEQLLPDGSVCTLGTVEEVTWDSTFGGGWWFRRTVDCLSGGRLTGEQQVQLEDGCTVRLHPEQVAFWLDRHRLPHSERLKSQLAAGRRQAFGRLYPDAPLHTDLGDGPDGELFRWKGHAYSGLPPRKLELLKCLWKNRSRWVGPQALEAAAWRDVTEMTDGALRSAARELNRFFDQNQLPFHVRVSGKGSYIKATILTPENGL